MDRKDVKSLIVEMTRASLADPSVQAAMQQMEARQAVETA